MITFRITDEQWPVLKIKLLRKYNHLTESDLSYQEGQEEELLTRLAKRLNRSTDYVLFTLSKGLTDLDSNDL